MTLQAPLLCIETQQVGILEHSWSDHILTCLAVKDHLNSRNTIGGCCAIENRTKSPLPLSSPEQGSGR